MSNNPDVPEWEPGDYDYRPCTACHGTGSVWFRWTGAWVPCGCDEIACDEPETEEEEAA